MQRLAWQHLQNNPGTASHSGRHSTIAAIAIEAAIVATIAVPVFATIAVTAPGNTSYVSHVGHAGSQLVVSPRMLHFARGHTGRCLAI